MVIERAIDYMITTLREIPIFSGVPDDELNSIFPLLKERNFKKNHILMFENDESEDIYLIRLG